MLTFGHAALTRAAAASAKHGPVLGARTEPSGSLLRPPWRQMQPLIFLNDSCRQVKRPQRARDREGKRTVG